MGNFSFHKFERLSKKKSIQELFEKGSSFTLYPFRVYYLSGEGDQQVHRVLFSVAKKNFKKAVDRNRIKRLMREAYRLTKHKIELPIKLHIAYIYIANDILPYQDIEKKMIASFRKLGSNEKVS